jgi:hypothetical protein
LEYVSVQVVAAWETAGDAPNNMINKNNATIGNTDL